MKIKKNYIAIIAIITLGCFFMPNLKEKYNDDAYADSASSSVVMEINSGRVLYENNAHMLRANASTTKIATFLVVLNEITDFDKVIDIDDRAVGIEGTSIYLRKGEKLTVRELLYGMMLPSGNDAATALALCICDSVEDFGELMTYYAKKAGAIKTTFKNPHGLDQKGHLTTAYDLAKITQACFKYPLFKEVVTTKNTKITDSSGDGYRYLRNKNKLLYSLENCTGVKTGYTSNAGRCLVSSAERNNMHLVSVVLNCRPMFEESSARIESLFQKYTMTEILPKNKMQGEILTDNSFTKSVNIMSKQGFIYPLKNDEVQKIKIALNIPQKLSAPTHKNQIVGEIKIYLDNSLLFCEKIYTIDSVRSNLFGDNAKRVIDSMLNK